MKSNSMRGRGIRSLLLGVSVFIATITITGAGEIPPSGSKPLSAIIKSLEGQGLGVITDAEFDNGRWEVKVCKGHDWFDLYINPGSGEENHRKTAHADDELPPANTKPLSSIIQTLEGRNLGVITDVEFDNGFWEVKLRKDGMELKLAIDPRTGEARR